MGRRLIQVVGMIVLALTFCARASASQSPLVLHLGFHRLSLPDRVSDLRASEHHVLLTLRDGRQLVIDDRTGARRYIPQEAGCPVDDMADPWVLFALCDYGSYTERLHLYNLRTRRLIRLAWGANLDTQFVLGSHWLWESTEYCGAGHGAGICAYPTFFRLPSLTANSWQPHGDLAGNVNSPTLKQHVCWSVSEQRSGVIGPFSSFEGPVISTLVWAGKLTVNDVWQSNSDTLELEGCSASPSIPLFNDHGAGVAGWLPSANQHALIWSPGGWTVDGIFIPSLHRLRMQLPVGPDPSLRGTRTPPLRLTSRHIWVLSSTGRVWEARFPTTP